MLEAVSARKVAKGKVACIKYGPILYRSQERGKLFMQSLQLSFVGIAILAVERSIVRVSLGEPRDDVVHHLFGKHWVKPDVRVFPVGMLVVRVSIFMVRVFYN